MVAAAEALTDPKAGIYGFVGRGLRNANMTLWTNFFLNYGGEFLDAKGNLLTDGPEAIEATKLYQRLLTKVAPPGVAGFNWMESMAAFTQGRAASGSMASAGRRRWKIPMPRASSARSATPSCPPARRASTRRPTATGSAHRPGEPEQGSVLGIILPALWWFFRDTWKELDADALVWRQKLRDEGKTDLRPFVALAMCAGDPDAAGVLRRPSASTKRPCVPSWRSSTLAPQGHPSLQVRRALRLRLVVVLARRGVPRAVRPLEAHSFKEDSLLDMGLRTRGFFKHAWIYGLFLRHRPAALAHRVAPARLRRLLPVLRKVLALLVRLPVVGGHVLRAVLRPRDVLPRLLAGSPAAQLRVGRHLRHGRALLHDPLRQAVSRGQRRDHRRHRARVRCRCGPRASTRASWCTSRWRR